MPRFSVTQTAFYVLAFAAAVGQALERCGCARGMSAGSSNCGVEKCRTSQSGYCQGGSYGCSDSGMCPLPGEARDGLCQLGTHLVCATTSKAVLDWFATVQNDL